MKSIVVFALLALIVSAKLDKYNVDISKTTISGLSSGAFMAVQMHFAFSSTIKGAAIFAGGPYNCAQGTQMTALTKCMSSPMTLNVDTLIKDANSKSSKGSIDDISNLKGSKVFLYSGKLDTVVKQGVVKKAEEMYQKLGASVSTKYDIASEHAYITENNGNACYVMGSPYINHCNYNGALESFKAIMDDFKEPTTMVDSNLKTFDQSSYTKTGMSMGDKGYIYVPTACQNGDECSIHVAFHGCSQTLADIDDKYARLLGINEVAEANNIIVVYPQAKKSTMAPSNPNGCWDWWGYSDGLTEKGNYTTKKGKQMSAVWQMINDIAGSSVEEELTE